MTGTVDLKCWLDNFCDKQQALAESAGLDGKQRLGCIENSFCTYDPRFLDDLAKSVGAEIEISPYASVFTPLTNFTVERKFTYRGIEFSSYERWDNIE